MYGKIVYDKDGNPKCEICGCYFIRVGVHLRHKHNITAKEYKKRFGLDFKQSLCSKKSSLKTSKKTLKNYDICIKNNLLTHSENWFIKGCHSGKYVSEQTRRRLINNIAHTWSRPSWFDKELNNNINVLKSMIISNGIYVEDTFQDTLFESMRCWYRWNRGKMSTWLYGIYKNLYKQSLCDRRFSELKEEYLDIEDEGSFLDVGGDVIKIDFSILTDYQKRFVDYLVEGKSVKEISVILGNSPKSVKSYKSLILNKIKKHHYGNYNRKKEIQEAKMAFQNSSNQQQGSRHKWERILLQ